METKLSFKLIFSTWPFFQIPTLPPSIVIDHNYCVTYFPGPDEMPPVHARGVISNIDDIIDGVVQVNTHLHAFLGRTNL